MKHIFIVLLIFCGSIMFAQPRFELTPQGFAPIEITRPQKTNEQLLDLTRAWADNYNRNEYDVYDVTENSVSVDGFKDNAFYYRNVGEKFYFRVKYTFKISFRENTITTSFIVKEIYTNKTLVQSTIADYFLPDGRSKEDFEEVKPSLEQTANNMLKSFSGFIGN